MSLAGEIFESCGAGALFDWHGDSASWLQPGAGAGTSCTVIVEPMQEDVSERQDGRAKFRKIKLSVRLSEVADPGRGGKVTIDGEVWFVNREIGRDGDLVVVEAGRKETIEKSRDARSIFVPEMDEKAKQF